MKSLVAPVLLALAVAFATVGWLPEERLTERQDTGDYTTDNNGRAIAADPDGNLHVVWFGDCGPENQVWYRWRDAGTGEWSAADTISSEPTGACRPSVAVDDSGNVHVVWQVGAFSNGTGIRYRQWNAAQQEWGQVESVADGHLCERPSVACRLSGLVVAAWHEQSPGIWKNAFCARRVNGVWLAGEQVSGFFDGHQTSVGVGVDSVGHLGVLWRAAHTTNWLIL
ncbi:hypothetical protein JXB37_05795, partial [candidate division WOR-3 bacterium]|nr:hypothetical protein [candidate division WOR-3 bacterium]